MRRAADGRFTRRGLMGLAAAALAFARAARAEPATLRFAVFRNGAHVGEQRMSFSGGQDSGLKVVTDVDLVVRLGPVPIFHYRHHALEQWSRDAFQRLETTTSSNGKRERVLALAAGDGVRIETQAGVWQAQPHAAPLTHWNPAVFNGPLFNPQTGKLLNVTTRHGPAERLTDGDMGRRWTVRGDAEIDDWYDAAGTWTALKGRLNDHSMLEYRRA